MPTFPSNLTPESLPEQLEIPLWKREPGKAPLDITIRPPGSKSITNRALLLAALAPGRSTLNYPLTDADDAQRMLIAIEQLGAQVHTHQRNSIEITGVGGRWKIDSPVTIDLNNAGTATRFLSASAMLADHPITITGNDRMQQRPIGELAELLKKIGCTVQYMNAQGYPPLTISFNKPHAQDQQCIIDIEPTQSSQYISALLLVACFLENGLTLRFPRGITSQSYVSMTIDLLDHLGVQIRSAADLSVVQVHPGLDRFVLDIEPDASGATYWWAAGAILQQSMIRVEGFDLNSNSLQGDAKFPELLEQMGCTLVARDRTLAVKGSDQLRSILCDMSDMPDAVMSLAAIACFAQGTTIIKGVKTLRVKECDRIEAMKVELAKIGVVITDDLNGDPDVLSVTPPEGGVDCSRECARVVFETYDDHRMAMSFALIGLRRPNVVIDDPRCVEKTYPGYFGDFARLY